jgi:hypothetical protein
MENEELKKLREPFPAHLISKLPRPTKQQTKEVNEDYKKGVRCDICGGWHHPKAVHLDYVGHAAVTYRLLDVDPSWTWEPLSMDASGLPLLDKDGGLWIKLTVCGVTRYGYGDAQGKTGGDAMKERIGDALRNAAMRFGAALDLWHKGELHPGEGDDDDKKKEPVNTPPKQDLPPDTGKKEEYSPTLTAEQVTITKWIDWLDTYYKKSLDELLVDWEKYLPAISKLSQQGMTRVVNYKQEVEKDLMEKK